MGDAHQGRKVDQSVNCLSDQSGAFLDHTFQIKDWFLEKFSEKWLKSKILLLRVEYLMTDEMLIFFPHKVAGDDQVLIYNFQAFVEVCVKNSQ